MAPKRIQRVLTTTDFSDESRAGLRYALALAEEFGAAVSLLHVIEPLPAIAGMEDVPIVVSDAEAAARAQTRLENIARRESTTTPVEAKVLAGRAFEQITAAARKQSADVIVIATHGYTGAKRVLLGSTAERVVRQASCPVLTVPTKDGSKMASFRLKKILLPIDFSKLSKDALPWAILVGRQFGAQVILLHVVQTFPIDYALSGGTTSIIRRLRTQARADLQDLAKSLMKTSRVKVSAAVRQGAPHAQICEAAKILDADLIVLTTHGYTGLKRLWLGSTAERVVRHAPCPVLAVRSIKGSGR